MNNKYSHQGFKFSMIGLILIILLIAFTLVLNTLSSYIYSLLIGALAFFIGIFAIVGFVKSLQGLKEPNTSKKIIGIIINLGIVMLFISVIIANFIDIYKAFT
ncbi:hypothetical protein [Mariniflexile sp. HMF6888]|uniref:hypothetical protein n=1 Tax=Mariniflexile sp. HMF6888 TaxID=3373086 RepID=UPI00379D1153